MKEQLTDFHNLLLVVITAITLLVLALLVYVMVRFNAKKNLTPTRLPIIPSSRWLGRSCRWSSWW